MQRHTHIHNRLLLLTFLLCYLLCYFLKRINSPALSSLQSLPYSAVPPSPSVNRRAWKFVCPSIYQPLCLLICVTFSQNLNHCSSLMNSTIYHNQARNQGGCSFSSIEPPFLSKIQWNSGVEIPGKLKLEVQTHFTLKGTPFLERLCMCTIVHRIVKIHSP